MAEVGLWAELGRGLDLVVCRGFSDTLGLAGRVCVRGCMRGDPIFGWKELGGRGPTPLREWVGLQLGDWHRSGDWGGMKNRRLGCNWSCSVRHDGRQPMRSEDSPLKVHSHINTPGNKKEQMGGAGRRW